MLNLIKKAAIAAAVLAVVPAIASAQTVAYGVAPVSVTSCAAADNTSFVGPISRGVNILHSSNDVALSYVNTSNVAATSVKFLVNDGNRTSSLIANGNFAPGVNVSRNFSADADGANGTAACTVAEVHFADGSVWHAGDTRLVGSR